MMKKLTYKVDIKNWLRCKHASELETLLRRERQNAFEPGFNPDRLERIKTAMLAKRAKNKANACKDWKLFYI